MPGTTSPGPGGRQRRGRPLTLPHDPSAMSSCSFAPWPRVAWLMLSVRMMGHDRSLIHREALLGRLHAQHLRVDQSRVSRWESGHHQVPGRVLLAYETILGRSPGSLLAIARGLVRASTATPPAPGTSPYPDDVTNGSKDLDTLLDQASPGPTVPAGPALTGGEWLQLAIELNRVHQIYLQSRVWAELCSRLIHELARTSGADSYLRYEACVALIGHPEAKRPLLRALGEWLTDPDVQISHPMIALLAEIRDTAAGSLVVRLLDTPTPVLAEGAVSVAATKLARGHFTGASIDQIEEYVLQRVLTKGIATSDVLDLLVSLPAEATDRIVAATRDPHLHQRVEQAVTHSSLAPSDVSRNTVKGIVANAQRDTPSPFRHEPDRMLHTLVEEALFHTHGVRRNLAAATLAASPYAASVADSCLALARSGDPLLASRGLAVAFRLDCCGREDELLELVLSETRSSLHAGELVTLGLKARPSEQDRRDAMAGAGCASSRTPRTGDHEAARVTKWWRDLGPALRDD